MDGPALHDGPALLAAVLERTLGEDFPAVAPHLPEIFAELATEYGDAARMVKDLRAAAEPTRPFERKGAASQVREGRLRILYVTGWFPSVEHAGGLRIFDILSELARHHEVDLYSTFNEAQDRASLEILRKRLGAVRATDWDGLWAPDVLAWLARLGRQEGHYDVVQLEYSRSVELLPILAPFGRFKAHTMQECMTRRRAIDVRNAAPSDRKAAAAAARWLLHDLLIEKSAMEGCELVIAVSDDDAQYAQRVFGRLPAVIPTGVSKEAVIDRLPPRKVQDAAIAPLSAAFIGYFHHSPNVDALDWYLSNVHDRVRQRLPGYRLSVIGRGSEVIERRLAGIPNINLVGRVDDIVPPLMAAGIGLAPIVSGAGIRGKIHQHSMLGRPSVATPLGANGLAYEHDQSIVIAKEPAEYADAIIRLLTDEPLRERIGNNAREVVAKHYSWSNIVPQIEALYRSREPKRARYFDPGRRPPENLYLTTSTSNLCNYKCRHCHIWTQKDPQNELTLEQRVNIVRQFGTLNPKGLVAISGGEVTMDMPELLAIAAACKQARLRCLITTNGSYITDPEIAKSIALSGLTWVTVSLDSHIPELHRYTRGVDGAYEDAMRAIRLLVEARDKYNPRDFVVTTACVVFDKNLPHLAEFIQFARGLGVNYVDFQVLSRTFSNQNPKRDTFFEQHFWHTPEQKSQAKKTIAEIVARFGDNGGFLSKSSADLDWLNSYITDPDFKTDEPICGSHEKNMVVDTLGRVSLCFNTPDNLPEPHVGNVREGQLVHLWGGKKAQHARLVMEDCTLGCGALNCHRR
jgi:MoaA/NifB/PqqE/SkfB family radical SAM enzyme/glycosyltransferase involved in cell wall biosynthesis